MKAPFSQFSLLYVLLFNLVSCYEVIDDVADVLDEVNNAISVAEMITEGVGVTSVFDITGMIVNFVKEIINEVKETDDAVSQFFAYSMNYYRGLGVSVLMTRLAYKVKGVPLKTSVTVKSVPISIFIAPSNTSWIFLLEGDGGYDNWALTGGNWVRYGKCVVYYSEVTDDIKDSQGQDAGLENFPGWDSIPDLNKFGIANNDYGNNFEPSYGGDLLPKDDALLYIMAAAKYTDWANKDDAKAFENNVSKVLASKGFNVLATTSTFDWCTGQSPSGESARVLLFRYAGEMWRFVVSSYDVPWAYQLTSFAYRSYGGYYIQEYVDQDFNFVSMYFCGSSDCLNGDLDGYLGQNGPSGRFGENLFSWPSTCGSVKSQL